MSSMRAIGQSYKRCFFCTIVGSLVNTPPNSSSAAAWWTTVAGKKPEPRGQSSKSPWYDFNGAGAVCFLSSVWSLLVSKWRQFSWTTLKGSHGISEWIQYRLCPWLSLCWNRTSKLCVCLYINVPLLLACHTSLIFLRCMRHFIWLSCSLSSLLVDLLPHCFFFLSYSHVSSSVVLQPAYCLSLTPSYDTFHKLFKPLRQRLEQ